MRGIAAILLAVFLFGLPQEVRAQTQSGGASDAGGSSGAGSSSGADNTSVNTAATVFPQWARDLRRGEIIAFGSFPFTWFFTRSAYETWKWGYYDNFSWDNRRYAPWPLKPAGAERLSNDEFLAIMGIAAIESVLIAVVDHILIRVRRNRAARAALRQNQGEIRVERSPWPPGSNPPPAGADEGGTAEANGTAGTESATEAERAGKAAGAETVNAGTTGNGAAKARIAGAGAANAGNGATRAESAGTGTSNAEAPGNGTTGMGSAAKNGSGTGASAPAAP